MGIFEKNGSGIFRSDIQIGVATLIKSGTLSDINQIIANGNMGDSYQVLKQSHDKTVIRIDLRKIAFQIGESDGIGEDLFYRLKRNEPYRYKIVSSDKSLELAENNTVVIRNPHSLNELLAYAGFGHVLNRNQMSEVGRILLSEEQILNIKARTARLSSRGIIDSSLVDEVNRQSAFLREYKSIELPTKPDIREKVLGKYFN